MNKEGKIYRSNGKDEPEHWHHKIVEDYGNAAETITNNNNWGYIDGFEGYEEIGLAEHYKGTEAEIVAEYAFDILCGKGSAVIYDDESPAVVNMANNIIKFIKETK